MSPWKSILWTFSSSAGEELDLGGDDCEEAESESSAQPMSNTNWSQFGDVDSMVFFASQELGWVEAMSRKKDCRPSSYCILGVDCDEYQIRN